MNGSYYKLRISGKDTKRFIRMLYKRGVFFENITYTEDSIFVKVDNINYRKIIDIKTIYEISVVKLYGVAKFKDFIKRYFFFLISLLLGTVFLFVLSNAIFDVEVIHSSKQIRDLLYSELEKYAIKKYKFAISFKKQEEIVEMILENNKDKLEWLEIERVGVKYKVRVEQRVMNDPIENIDKRHIVAKKDGTILSISAENGEIVKKTNSYVRKGEIIISGNLKKGEEVISTTSAKGRVFAEVWYMVTVELPFQYKEISKTGNNKKVLAVSILGNNYNILDFKPYKSKNIEELITIRDGLSLFKISFNDEEELNIIDEVYDITNVDLIVERLAKEKIESMLSKEDKIISQKKLKTEEKNSKIVSEVFFKVYEDITAYEKINEEIR